MDAREGGKWRHVQKMQDGTEFVFFGVFHEVTPSERVVQTFEFSGLPERGHVILEKMELEELEGNKTKLKITQSFFSVQDRDGMIQNGMEEGVQNTYNKLDEVLAEAE